MDPSQRRLRFAVGSTLLTASLSVVGCNNHPPTVNPGPEPPHVNEGPEPDPDAETPDAETPDAETEDAETEDAETPDAETEDPEVANPELDPGVEEPRYVNTRSVDD